MSSVTVSVVVFACVFGGAVAGLIATSFLPARHTSPETKEVVRLGMGLVATTVAIALGLLIASAKSFYDTQSSEMTQLAANVVMLDRVLAHYGPDAKEARVTLKETVTRMTDRSENGMDSSGASIANEGFYDKLQELSPHDDQQRALQAQASSLTIQMGQTRWLMFAQETIPVPMPLLVIMVLWLTVLFTSFGLFVRPNFVVVLSLFISALAVCAAIFLILEMYQPYTGLIRVSAAPLRAAAAQLGR